MSKRGRNKNKCDICKVNELMKFQLMFFPYNNPFIRVLEKNGFVKTSDINEYRPLSHRCRNSLIYILKNKNNELYKI